MAEVEQYPPVANDVFSPLKNDFCQQNLAEEDNLVEDEIAKLKENENSPNMDESEKPVEDEWLDIMGSGNFKKKVLKPGLGIDTRPDRSDKVTISVSLSVDGSVFERHENLSFIVGDLEVIQGIDLVVCLMEKGEVAKVLIPSKLAYGKTGKLPDVPPDTDIECDIELKEIDTINLAALTLSESLQYGEEKRLRGNYFYERGEIIEAIHCYERAAEFLDSVRDSSGSSTEESQKVVDMRIKVYNNMAASHLKLGAHSAALKSVDSVLSVQPNNVKALFRKAKILSAEGSTDEAVNCLKKAISIEGDAKDLQAELSRLLARRKREMESQKAMYQRMFQQSATPKQKRSFSKLLKWGALTGGLLAIAVGMAACRQMHS